MFSVMAKTIKNAAFLAPEPGVSHALDAKDRRYPKAEKSDGRRVWRGVRPQVDRRGFAGEDAPS